MINARAHGTLAYIIKDITLISIVVSVSSVASIIQQVYYACAWRTIKETAWEQANASAELPSIAFGPLSTGLNLALFEIQYICYSINALLVLGWYVLQPSVSHALLTIAGPSSSPKASTTCGCNASLDGSKRYLRPTKSLHSCCLLCSSASRSLSGVILMRT